MKNRRRGSAIVEAALMMPWIVFLFVGVLDFGFYSYAAICTQNAARAAAIATSANSTAQTNSIACTAALRELNVLPNMVGVTTCQTSAGAVDSTHPAAAFITLPVLSCTTAPQCADCTAAACSAATPPAHPTSAQVSVTYQTMPMVPIPGVLTGKMTLTRTVEMRILQ